MNEVSVKSSTSTGDIPPVRTTRERRRYGRLLAETQLTTIFNCIVDQPTPEEFLDLLQQIDARCASA